MTNKERAVELLVHYFGRAMAMSADNVEEVGDAVECIIDAAVEQAVKRIKLLERDE